MTDAVRTSPMMQSIIDAIKKSPRRASRKAQHEDEGPESFLEKAKKIPADIEHQFAPKSKKHDESGEAGEHMGYEDREHEIYGEIRHLMETCPDEELKAKITDLLDELEGVNAEEIKDITEDEPNEEPDVVGKDIKEHAAPKEHAESDDDDDDGDENLGGSSY